MIWLACNLVLVGIVICKIQYVKLFCIHVCKLVTVTTEADNDSDYGLVVGV